MKRPETPNTTGSPGPRRPDITPAEFAAIASALQAKQRSRLTRLSSAGRLRKWGSV